MASITESSHSWTPSGSIAHALRSNFVLVEGWATWIVIVIAGAVLFLINTKLMWVARYATRGGHVHRLKPGVFWLHRPWLFLPVIKSLLFFVSFVFANSAFFAWQFGASSCFFSRTGFQGHPVPWWVSHCIGFKVWRTSFSTLRLFAWFAFCLLSGGEAAHLAVHRLFYPYELAEHDSELERSPL